MTDVYVQTSYDPLLEISGVVSVYVSPLCVALAGGCNIEGEEDSWDFGTGAGFYVDATEEKWKTNYRMFSYVTKELRAVVDKYFNTNGKQSVTGHRYVSVCMKVVEVEPMLFE